MLHQGDRECHQECRYPPPETQSGCNCSAQEERASGDAGVVQFVPRIRHSVTGEPRGPEENAQAAPPRQRRASPVVIDSPVSPWPRLALPHGDQLKCPQNTGDKLRSSIACAGFVCFIPLLDRSCDSSRTSASHARSPHGALRYASVGSPAHESSHGNAVPKARTSDRDTPGSAGCPTPCSDAPSRRSG